VGTRNKDSIKGRGLGRVRGGKAGREERVLG